MLKFYSTARKSKDFIKKAATFSTSRIGKIIDNTTEVRALLLCLPSDQRKLFHPIQVQNFKEWSNKSEVEKAKYSDKVRSYLDSITNYFSSLLHSEIVKQIKESPPQLSRYEKLVANYCSELQQIPTLSAWIVMNHEDKKTKYSSNLRIFLNSVCAPIFQEIEAKCQTNQSLLHQCNKLFSLHNEALYSLWTLEKWTQLAEAEKQTKYDRELIKFFEEMEHLSFTAQLSNLLEIAHRPSEINFSETVELLRNQFFTILQLKYDKKSLDHIVIALDERIVEDGLELASITNTKTASVLLGRFFKPNARMKLPADNSAIRMQFLGLLDDTDVTTNHQLESNTLQTLQSSSTNTFSFKMLLGPSGSGKTHDMIRIASKHYCLFFNGAYNIDLKQTGDLNNSSEFGFMDMSVASLVNKTKSLVQEFELYDPLLLANYLIEYLTEVLILSRLIYLEELNKICQRKFGRDVLPKEYLFLQVMDNNKLTQELFIQILEAKLSPFTVKELIAAKSKHGLFIVLDECNILRSPTNICPSSYKKNTTSNFLTPVAKALAMHAKVLFFAGTNANMTTKEFIVNAIGEEFEDPLPFQSKFAENIEQVKSWLDDFIDISECDAVFLKYAKLLQGVRIRTVMRIIKEISLNRRSDILTKSQIMEEAIINAIEYSITGIADQFLKVYNKKYEKAQQYLLNKFAVEFIYQFIRFGEFKSTISLQLDLTYLCLCWIHKHNMLYSNEIIAFKAMIRFLESTNTLSSLIIYFINLGYSFKYYPSFLRILTEEMFGALILISGKMSLLQLVPGSLLQDQTLLLQSPWLKNISFETHFIYRNTHNISDVLFIKNALKDGHFTRLSGNIGPDFIWNISNADGTRCVMTVGVTTSLRNAMKAKNLESINLSNLIAKTKDEELVGFEKALKLKTSSSDTKLHQLRICIELGYNKSSKSKVKVSDQGNIVTVFVRRDTFHELFPRSIQEFVKRYLTSVVTDPSNIP